MDNQTLLMGLGAIAFVIIAYLILDTDSGKTKKRIEKIGGSEKDRKSALSFMKVDDNSQRRKMIESSLEELEKKKKVNNKKKKSLKAKLIQADMAMTPKKFTIISVIIGLVVGLVPLLLGKLFLALGLAFVVGFGLPRWLLNMKIARRQKKFAFHFADAMDVIVRGVRTGLPLNDCLGIIAHESPYPVGDEFKRLVEAEKVGVPLETCIERMYDRMPLPEVNFFGTVLAIQRQTGGNLGESLDNLSKVLRGRKVLREKVKALAAEAKASAMIIGALPVIVMVLVTIVQPDYMDDLYFTKRGQINMMIGAGMMVVGTVVMRKMINFKV